MSLWTVQGSRYWNKHPHIAWSDATVLEIKDVQIPGIEPGSTAWQAAIIPLNQICICTRVTWN